jgi:hypothetical protein
MIINVKRTGGYAGLNEEVAALDTGRLEDSSARRAEQLLADANFFNLPADAAEEVGADTFRYEITASDGGRSHAVSFSEGNPKAAPLLELVENLKRLARDGGAAN